LIDKSTVNALIDGICIDGYKFGSGTYVMIEEWLSSQRKFYRAETMSGRNFYGRKILIS